MSTATHDVPALARALGIHDHPRLVMNPPHPEGLSPDGTLAVSANPATGEPIAAVRTETRDSLDATLGRAHRAFLAWRNVPAPTRGLVVRAIADEFRRLKEPLGRLVSLEVGKILQEGLGEVQETIDIADYAVGLSRQLPGLTLPSERPEHRLIEQWHPLGPIGVITAFNFPNAVWGWNAMLAAVCGDTTVWKPSLFAPLTALATNHIAQRVASSMGHDDLFTLAVGPDDTVAKPLVDDKRLPLISATGSCRMGRLVGEAVARRLGRCLLELGGNNAAIIDASADLDLAVPAVVFGAVGTAGQRCTTTRRLIVHESLADEVTRRLVKAYATIRIGDPLAEGTLVGPLISDAAVRAFLAAVEAAKAQGGRLLCGGTVARVPGLERGRFVTPAIIRAPSENRLPIAHEETFAPILYVFTTRTLDEAIVMNNSADQGLSSAIFTDSLRNAERFLAPAGSDCGIANVNAGTSGAEIGGAFGGEKDTGGGRESGSDSWKAYMRRQTCTINHGSAVRLAQGITFERRDEHPQG
ncbi:MAG: aldehyde dehydrogenase family protein [Phycisphaeraceae bacterium]|nr:MAG: aldehyde dehydrogenase family protein [Phycisphaeraceae bacterium]